MYGYAPPHLALGAYLQTSQITALSFIQDRQHMINTLKDNMLLAQQRMKLYIDTHRMDRTSFVQARSTYSLQDA